MNKKSLRDLVGNARAAGRTALSAPEAEQLCAAYGIPTPKQGLAKTAAEAVRLAARLRFPVALKIVSDDILHKTEAGGVVVGLKNPAEVRRAFDQLVRNAKRYKKTASIQGAQVQQMVAGGQEVMVGAVTDPSFGKMVAFGLGGILVEVMKDITFRLAPVSRKDALSMLDSVGAAEVLRGVRGQKGVDRAALADILCKVSKLVTDFPEIQEVDLNPIFATETGAKAVDVRIVLGDKAKPRERFSQSEILTAMQRIMNPRSVAVIGASAEDGKIGNSVMKNLINGGYQGAIYPIHPKADEILGRKAFSSVLNVADEIDVAVFAIPAKFCAAAMDEVGRKKIPGAVMIPSGFAEVGEQALQDELLAVARKHSVRVMGPNIYGFYYTPQNLCATFCTPYDVKGKVALSSQSGGVGMSIIGFSRATRMGVSAIVGLGNKSDLDEDDLLTYFEQDANTQVIAMHCEDLKDGRSFAGVASRVSKKKPIVMLKAGRTALGARAAASHTGALAGNDKIYDDVLRQCGVIRAKSLNDLLQFARGLQVLP
ncbi:MAG TPA: acetate--CoA ligase family protein, partial [Candidatus Limnocylindria bacterium]|nr:acetate--CoA ligase family protein [Candidatus Limnocylindria bacterium]